MQQLNRTKEADVAVLKAVRLGTLGSVAAMALLSVTTAWAQAPAFALQSPAFKEGEAIPLKHSAYGDNVSPALSWSNAPAGTRSLALVLDDPDAPTPQPFVHWVIYNIPAGATGLPEGLPTQATLESPHELHGATQGPGGMRQTGYFGPRPPAGAPHHYHFTLYALSSAPDLPQGLNKAQLLERIQGSILGQAKLIGVYQAN
jgi:Raf kinase inhibitor-like YbhB/YbcL family protein